MLVFHCAAFGLSTEMFMVTCDDASQFTEMEHDIFSNQTWIILIDWFARPEPSLSRAYCARPGLCSAIGQITVRLAEFRVQSLTCPKSWHCSPCSLRSTEAVDFTSRSLALWTVYDCGDYQRLQASRQELKGIIRVSKLQGIDLFYYLLDLREPANSNDTHQSLVGALFWKKLPFKLCQNCTWLR